MGTLNPVRDVCIPGGRSNAMVDLVHNATEGKKKPPTTMSWKVKAIATLKKQNP